MPDQSDIIIRALTPADEPFLWEMLYQALYVPEGADPFPRDIVRRPEISRYAQGWGQADDLGFVVSTDNPALRLYQRSGFEVIANSGNSFTMIKRMAAGA